MYTQISHGTRLICIYVALLVVRFENETRIPPTMRLNNSLGVKESRNITSFRCLSLRIYNRVDFLSLSLSDLDSIWTGNNSSLVFTFGTFSTRRDV